MGILGILLLQATMLICCCLVQQQMCCNGKPMNTNELYWQKVMLNMNRSAEPCEDFYEYACGNWMLNYDNANEYLDVPGYMEYEVNRQLQDLLHRHQHDDDDADDDATGIYSKLWQYYQSCVQLSSPALNDYLYLLEAELNFSWPIFRSNWSEPWANDTHFDWLGTLATLRVYGLNNELITQHVSSPPTNSSRFLIELQRHAPERDLKAKEVADIFRMVGMPDAANEQATARVMAFEAKLSQLKLPPAAHTANDSAADGRNYTELALSELVARVPHPDWLAYFGIVFGRTLNASALRVQSTAADLAYFGELAQALRAETNETICYYLMFKFINHLNAQLPLVRNTSVPCVKHLRGYMPLAMNYLYEQHVYQARRRRSDAVLHGIYERLRANFELLLAENHLRLNSRECDFVLEELQTMRLKVGNVPAPVNRSYVERYYAEVTMNASNFYANHLQLLRHFTRQQQAALWLPPNISDVPFFEHEPGTASSSSPVKVFYNGILVPHGFLQLPLFHADLHELFHYSLFGVILAHEIAHAYDLFHVVYDAHSNYNPLGMDVLQHYAAYMNCTGETPGITLSENMADVVGLRLAYRTYFSDVSTTGRQRYADGEGESAWRAGNFTAAQVFFINSVQFLCANMPQIDGLNVKPMDLGHDMHDARVHQNWANFEKFAEAFHCPANTRMHPQQFCRLW